MNIINATFPITKNLGNSEIKRIIEVRKIKIIKNMRVKHMKIEMAKKMPCIKRKISIMKNFKSNKKG